MVSVSREPVPGPGLAPRRPVGRNWVHGDGGQRAVAERPHGHNGTLCRPLLGCLRRLGPSRTVAMALQPWGLGFSIWVWLPTALPVRASCSRLTEPIEGSARLQPPACISSCTRSRGLLGRRPPGGGGQQAGVDRRGQRRRTRRKRRVSTGRSRKREGVCLLKPKACPTLGPGSLLSAWNPPGKIPGVCARPSSRGSSSRELLLR